MNSSRHAARGGFTLTEVLLSASLSSLAAAAVATAFIWCSRGVSLSGKIAWSQNEAMITSAKLTAYVRNASEIVGIDEREGTWVSLRFPDGSIGRLVYSNAVPELRDGRMYIQQTNGTFMLVARGLTEIQNTNGYTTPVFSSTRDNSLRIAYRVAQPAAGGDRDANDGPYAACMRFGASLRNHNAKE
jgi:hypothetical protein